jgi:hypothetical protein
MTHEPTMSKPAAALTWRAYKILQKKMKMIGWVIAPTEEEAVAAACLQYQIPEHDKHRIVVRREE